MEVPVKPRATDKLVLYLRMRNYLLSIREITLLIVSGKREGPVSITGLKAKDEASLLLNEVSLLLSEAPINNAEFRLSPIEGNANFPVVGDDWT